MFFASNSGLPLSSVRARRVLRVLIDQRGNLQQEVRARMRAECSPLALFVGFARVLDGLVHVGLVALGDERQHLLVGRVEGLESLAGLRRHPLSIDEKFLGALLRNSSAALDLAPRVADSNDADADAIFPNLLSVMCRPALRETTKNETTRRAV